MHTSCGFLWGNRMKTKREVLESVVKIGSCEDIKCEECPYNSIRCHDRFFKIGAMALLRMFPEKREFDTDKILTCVTADKAKTGMRGYFADDLVSLKINFEKNFVYELLHIHSECFSYRFRNANRDYALFYPIDGVEE